MFIREVEFSNFRNLVDDKISFNEYVNIFIGKNGQGKTNLLESLYLISLTKSFKTNKLNNLIAFEKDYFNIRSVFDKSNYSYDMNFSYINNKKNILINNNSITKFKDVIGLLNVILFVPEDMMLLKRNPSNRRRLIDIELSKVYPNYLISLSSYMKVLKQRNSLLKENNFDKNLITVYNLQLVKYGEIIYKYRLDFFNEIGILINDIYKEISNSEDIITIDYLSNVYKKGSYIENIERNFERDMMFKQTHIGIHRDDFMILINNKDAAHFSSQGEQRSIILSLKLSLIKYVKNKTGEYPILLLDDVMSELDEFRQYNLLKILNNKVQTFITTTSLNNLNSEFMINKKIFNIDEGKIWEV